MKITNYLLSALLMGTFACNSNPTKEKAEETKEPNIVIIFADDMGYGDLGTYGATQWETPNLDKLAHDGTRFTQFYVPHAVCSASRAALLTGAYANRLEIFGALDHSAKHGLNLEETTIAEMLKKKGYHTGIVGKWHLGHQPEFLPSQQGFDSYFGLPYSNDMWPHHPETKDYYPPLPLYEGDSVIKYLDEQSQLTTWYTEKAVSFIEENKEGPFFLYLAHSMPHVPLYVSDKFKGKSEQGLYGDVMMEIDWSVGQVRSKLEELGLADNTLIIFTSDNGPWLSYGGHAGTTGGLREGKGTSLDGGIRVPAIFTWPGHIPADKEQAQPAMTIDIFPTIAALTDSKLPDLKIDGRNIWPLIEGEKMEEKPYYAYYNRNELQAVIYGKWKVVYPHRYRTIPEGTEMRNDGFPVNYLYLEFEKKELYDMENDPSETTDVKDKYPEVMAQMDSLANIARADMGDALNKMDGPGLRKHGTIEEEK
ncbi:sulfatase family protein [Algoriphagus zhangzhouensis]|uniref:C-terminal region of aryl-sulfatase n=1 Tax=Algoriphagus zhangzhouensis TaxID=1073327 RepID=A0A1M7Z776_9BACT|nr:sulfatase [Algoriphagus zhangzhouensis]TDY49296.1 arylsulfatase A-like enzyme [Algoriphagus zhangzhouensis]SHO60729.1 C-terminal region of aryl-sulfatase [Algoriphagus zhangzhouensis]